MHFDSDDDDLGPRGIVVDHASDDDEDLGPQGLQGVAPQLQLAALHHVVREVQLEQQQDQPRAPPDRGRTATLSEWVGPVSDFHKGVLQCVSGPVIRHRCTVHNISNMFDHVAGPHPRAAAGIGTESALLDMCRQSYTEMLTEVAATTFQTSMLICSGAIRQIVRYLAQGLQPIAAFTGIMFDETPILTRIPEDQRVQPIAAQGHGKTATPKSLKCIAKVMQSDAMVSFLLSNPGQPQPMLVQIPITTSLQVLDHYTGEVVADCIRRTFESVPGLCELLNRFPKVCHMSCSDRASTNNKAEKGLVLGRSAKESRFRTTCDVHKAYSCQQSAYDVQRDLISGLVNFSLAMKPGGALKTLREALTTLFKDLQHMVSLM